MFMFMDKSEPLNFGEQFAARQREQDIASKGFSLIKAPKSMKRVKKLPKEMLQLKETVEKELLEQESLLRGIANRIHHRANLALRKLNAKDRNFAVSAMRSIVEQQQEFIQISIWKRALQVYLSNILCGLASSKNPRKDFKALRHAHETAEKPIMPEYSQDHLLARLRKKDLFPLVHFNEGSVYHVLYSDTPPFCNHDVAQERAKDIASRGYSKITIPSGYVKRDKPTMRMVPAIRLVRAGIHEQEDALLKLVLRIQELARVAALHVNQNAPEEAAVEMRAIRELQHAYLHHSQIIEGYKAYENHLMYGLVDVTKAEQDLQDLKSTPPTYKQQDETDAQVLQFLKERKFFPKLFPLLGTSGVNICFSENPPTFGNNKKGPASNSNWDTKSAKSDSTTRSSLSSSDDVATSKTQKQLPLPNIMGGTSTRTNVLLAQ